MANQRDINRWKKGKDHWNKWARGRLKAKEKLAKWDFEEKGMVSNMHTQRWLRSAGVDFSKHFFLPHTDFSDFIFPHTATFQEARFQGKVIFDRARFVGNANFDEVIFNDDAHFVRAVFSFPSSFSEAMFTKYAYFALATFTSEIFFGKAAFSKYTTFEGASFFERTWFGSCQFNDSTSFDEANFNGNTSFQSATSKSYFSLVGSTFQRVPDFIQMTFHAPPRLDDINVIPAEPFRKAGNKEKAARYRALKKMAIESHDHVREQEFFASEARERRGNDDLVWSAAWILSFPYEFLSDFGRSIAMPFWSWFCSTLAFWLIYLFQRDFTANLTCKIDPAWEALYLSLKSAFLVIGWERSAKLNQVYACLYGGIFKNPELPVAIPFLQIGQTLWSAVLIFLFFLAVRNHFKIK